MCFVHPWRCVGGGGSSFDALVRGSVILGSHPLITHTLKDRAARAGWLCALFVWKPGAWEDDSPPLVVDHSPLGRVASSAAASCMSCIPPFFCWRTRVPTLACVMAGTCAGRWTRRSNTAAGGCGGCHGFQGDRADAMALRATKSRRLRHH